MQSAVHVKKACAIEKSHRLLFVAKRQAEKGGHITRSLILVSVVSGGEHKLYQGLSRHRNRGRMYKKNSSKLNDAPIASEIVPARKM